jgi:hypothetical protein
MVPQSQIGFIDFIVSPTLGVAGEAVALILANKRDQERPWTDILAANKAKWQAKVTILQRKSHLCIPFLGIARPQSQFSHS